MDYQTAGVVGEVVRRREYVLVSSRGQGLKLVAEVVVVGAGRKLNGEENLREKEMSGEVSQMMLGNLPAEEVSCQGKECLQIKVNAFENLNANIDGCGSYLVHQALESPPWSLITSNIELRFKTRRLLSCGDR